MQNTKYFNFDEIKDLCLPPSSWHYVGWYVGKKFSVIVNLLDIGRKFYNLWNEFKNLSFLRSKADVT